MFNLKPRRIVKQDLDKFDMIFAMNINHYKPIKEIGVNNKKFKMFLELTPEHNVSLSDLHYTKDKE